MIIMLSSFLEGEHDGSLWGNPAVPLAYKIIFGIFALALIVFCLRADTHETKRDRKREAINDYYMYEHQMGFPPRSRIERWFHKIGR